jgi:hypothetical protein
MTRIVVHGTPRHTPTARNSGSRYAYGYASGRRQPGYAYGYAPSPAYYGPPPKRRYGYVPAKPRRYVSRGVFQGSYGN